jgi:hypothetical protein
MKFYIIEEPIFGGYRVIKFLAGSMYHYDKFDICADHAMRLCDTLQEKFENIQIYDRLSENDRREEYRQIFVKFDDPADEAFFLIWSNDGFEI